MAKNTDSELAFQKYLSKIGIKARFEELPNGITQPVDFSFEIDGKTLRVDVKEWKPKAPLRGIVSFNTSKTVRKKIEAGRDKFR